MNDYETVIKLPKQTNHFKSHDKNIEIKEDILSLLLGDEKELVKSYETVSQANYYRQVAIKFLKQLENENGIDVLRNGTNVIISKGENMIQIKLNEVECEIARIKKLYNELIDSGCKSFDGFDLGVRHLLVETKKITKNLENKRYQMNYRRKK